MAQGRTFVRCGVFCMITIVLILLVFSLSMNIMMYNSVHQHKRESQDLLGRVLYANNKSSKASRHSNSTTVEHRLDKDVLKRPEAGKNTLILI